MMISKNAVVTLDYTLTKNDGTVLDSTSGRDPLVYLHGTGTLFPVLEKALDGKGKGTNIRVPVSPEEGFGVRDERAVQTVSRSAFQGAEVKVGSQFRSQGQGGAIQVVTVTKIEGENVTVDANHPLAGVPVTFEVTVKDVREATQEEIAHGHVHGPGGHHHH